MHCDPRQKGASLNYAMRGLLGTLMLLPMSLAAQDPDHVMQLASRTAVAGGSVELPLWFDNVQELGAYQTTIAHDPDLLSLLDLVSGPITQQLFPEFLQVSFYPDGFTLVVAYMQAGLVHLPSGSGHEVHRAIYHVNEGIPSGVTSVAFSTDIGNPPMVSTMTNWPLGAPIDPTLIDGSVEIVEGFLRGNVNLDDTIDLADPIYLAQWLFQQGQAPGCLDAADSNDDSVIDIADVVTILAYLFQSSGGSISGICEIDSMVDPLGCNIPNCP
ncbi:MAG: hypothetical protein VX764_02340 [Planctomycetota bacterium]|nr:hypothetical protein [Planctomycetota bacterium]